MNKFKLTVCLLFAIVFTSVADDAIDSSTCIFDSNFKSLQVNVSGNDYFPPIITLNSDDRIVISFDELSTEVSYLRYSLVHCNANWQPSDLVESEFINGFNYANIEDYAFSSGTFSHFIHYSFSLPNENMQLLVSGNYLVKVYTEDNPDDILLQARFSVCENAVSVGTSVTSRTDIDYNDTHQQVSFTVNTLNYNIRNMYTDIIAYVYQNSRTDNVVFVNKPLMASTDKATFDHNKSLIFPAGNEFRRMETVATNYPTMGVASIEYHNPYYFATLDTDFPRVDTPYSYDKTQFGQFTIRNADANDSATEADYIVTHFSLNMGGPVSGGKIYLNGEFTNNLFNSASLMKYDSSTGLYTNDMLLKQGAYNYQYLFLPDGTSVAQTSTVEGNKYQTVNEYLVMVYNRQPIERYDRFIGFGIVYSGK